MSKLSEAQDELDGSITRAGDVHTFENSAPIWSRHPTDTCIGNFTDTSFSDSNIIKNNIDKFSTRKRAYPALDVANPMVNNRVDTIPTCKSSQLANHPVTMISLNVRLPLIWQLP